jgi:hypothetical protein
MENIMDRPGNVDAHLDHVIVMFDAPAYADLLASGDQLGTALGRYAVKQSESSLAGRYSAAVVMGSSTLVEFFDVGAPPLPGITAGMVFSFEVPHSVWTAKSALTDAGVEFGYELVHRAVDGEAQMRPWYHLLRPDLGEDNPFLLMVTEVTPEYFASIGATPQDDRLSRRQYLDAGVGRGREPGQAMRDISSVQVRLRPKRARVVRNTLIALGFTEVGDDSRSVLRGVDSTVVIVSAEQAPEGVLSIGLELEQTPAPDSLPHRFGDTSTLDLSGQDGMGEWRFEPAPAPGTVSTVDTPGR